MGGCGLSDEVRWLIVFKRVCQGLSYAKITICLLRGMLLGAAGW